MVSKAKLYSKLDTLEAQLREALIPHLQSAVDGDNDLVFCVNAFNPFRELRHQTDRLTEELVAVGAQILTLRNKLGEPCAGTVAERICWYCREWSQRSRNESGLGPTLARQFLIEIEPT